MGKKVKKGKVVSYLICTCAPLCDQYECEADVRPLCIVSDPISYLRGSYNIYEIYENGQLSILKHYDD